MLLPQPIARRARTTHEAETESVHRTANERHEHEAADSEMVVECECHRAECGSDFTVSLSSYERVRAVGRRFLVAPGHQHEDESIITAGREYFVIEKIGDEGSTAEALDPRT